MSMPRLPTELLELIVPHIVNDSASLSMLCLASPVLAPACRVARFYSVTLERVDDTIRFHGLLETSPKSHISRHVRRLAIIDPQDYIEHNIGKNALISVLERVRAFISDLQIFSHDLSDSYSGIDWTEMNWLQDELSNLPSLRTFGTEDWGTSISKISTLPYYRNITALGIFAFPHTRTAPDNVERLSLSAFRLSDIGTPPAQEYWASPLLRWLDLSRLRSLAFCSGMQFTLSTTGTWLSGLLQHCSASLEYLVLEARNPPDDLELPVGGCPSLTKVTFMIRDFPRMEWNDLLLLWVNVLLNQCPSLKIGEITFSLMFLLSEDESQGLLPALSLKLETLLNGLGSLKGRYPSCRIALTYPGNRLLLERECFPPSLILEFQCTYVKFWTRFYSIEAKLTPH
ncbi:hypothetical protein DL96DRAFT_1820038 [Flagelloscypha sp. PMI_526]|nr:hypothetical protein DL96DRAFT_1820038 [Flagelloscypha sp. PMI_526]